MNEPRKIGDFVSSFLDEWIPWNPVHASTMAIIAVIGVALTKVPPDGPIIFFPILRWCFVASFVVPVCCFCYSDRDPFGRQTKKLVTAMCLSAMLILIACR